jgi:hypothetical protein
MDMEYLASGKSLVTSKVSAGLQARIFMSRLLDPRRPRQGILTGEINPVYLWGTGEESTLPPNAELCVVDHETAVLFCSLELPPSIRKQLAIAVRQNAIGLFEWEQGGNGYLAGYRLLRLRSSFLTRPWC